MVGRDGLQHLKMLVLQTTAFFMIIRLLSMAPSWPEKLSNPSSHKLGVSKSKCKQGGGRGRERKEEREREEGRDR